MEFAAAGPAADAAARLLTDNVGETSYDEAKVLTAVQWFVSEPRRKSKRGDMPSSTTAAPTG
jgi:hypothetical protein